MPQTKEELIAKINELNKQMPVQIAHLEKVKEEVEQCSNHIDRLGGQLIDAIRELRKIDPTYYVRSWKDK